MGERNDDSNETSSDDENEDSLEDENDAEDSHSSDLIYKARNGTRFKKRKVPGIIRYVRYNKKKRPGKLLQRTAHAFYSMAK